MQGRSHKYQMSMNIECLLQSIQCKPLLYLAKMRSLGFSCTVGNNILRLFLALTIGTFYRQNIWIHTAYGFYKTLYIKNKIIAGDERENKPVKILIIKSGPIRSTKL